MPDSFDHVSAVTFRHGSDDERRWTILTGDDRMTKGPTTIIQTA
jgi:hypothetical protein